MWETKSITQTYVTSANYCQLSQKIHKHIQSIPPITACTVTSSGHFHFRMCDLYLDINIFARVCLVSKGL